MTVLISAHRGGGEVAPRGTWEAYEHALSIGADYVEFDVRKTGDGELVVFHDEQVRGRPLRSLTKDELSELAGYEVPGVPDLMAKMAGRSHGHVDMKESGYEGEVVSLARELLGDDAFVVTGGDGCIATVKRLFPGIRCALSLGRDMWEIPMTRYVQVRRSELNPVERLRACGAEWVAVHRRYAVIGTLRTCAAHGIGAMVWTVNNSAMIRRFLRDPRVNVLITDRPAYAMEQRSLLTGRAT